MMDGQVGNLSQRVLEKLVVIFKVKIKKTNPLGNLTNLTTATY